MRETDELIALVAAAQEFNGGYISHIRSEGDRYLEALDELIAISRATGARAQVYHLKPAGEANWDLSEAGLGAARTRRAPKGSTSPPTSTPTSPARPGSTRRCRLGCRRAA